MPHFYVNAHGGYEVHDTPATDPTLTPVPERPTHEHRWDAEAGESGEWVLETEADRKRAMGKVPTNEFIATVFAPPSDDPDPDPLHTWNREGQVRFASKQIDTRMPKDGYLSGTKAEVTQMAQWLLTNRQIPNTYPPVYESVEPDEHGQYIGGIITMEEYARALAMLDEYGVQ